MKYTIFYSWQSDLPNNTNRGFLEGTMEAAIKDFKNNDLYELEPSIDRDTKNIPGSPNITQVLIDKIRTSDAFVADISIVTGDTEKGQRPSPNPNVMLELGYAIALLGWDRIILFCNELYGKDEDLPFDIRQHRQIKYSLAPNDPKTESKKELSQLFGKRLIELIEHGKASTSIKEPIISAQWSSWDKHESLVRRGIFLLVALSLTFDALGKFLRQGYQHVVMPSASLHCAYPNPRQDHVLCLDIL